MVDDSKFPASLRAGDQVIVGGRNPERVMLVERVTKTQVILASSSYRFRRDNGQQIGGGRWAREVLAEATPERIKSLRDAQEKKRQ